MWHVQPSACIPPDYYHGTKMKEQVVPQVVPDLIQQNHSDVVLYKTHRDAQIIN
jgi:hypothetical protein